MADLSGHGRQEYSPPPLSLEPLDSRKIVVLGVPWQTEDSTLHQHFSQYGTLEDCQIMRERYTGKSRGFAFITFSAQQDAQHAIAAEHHLIDGRRCEAKLALPEGKIGSARTTRIFIARIPSSVTDIQFRGYFEQFGLVQDAYMPKDPQKQGHRGIGFVTYSTPDSVERVMAETHVLNGNEVAIDRATPKERSAMTSFLPGRMMSSVAGNLNATVYGAGTGAQHGIQFDPQQQAGMRGIHSGRNFHDEGMHGNTAIGFVNQPHMHRPLFPMHGGGGMHYQQQAAARPVLIPVIGGGIDQHITASNTRKNVTSNTHDDASTITAGVDGTNNNHSNNNNNTSNDGMHFLSQAHVSALQHQLSSNTSLNSLEAASPSSQQLIHLLHANAVAAVAVAGTGTGYASLGTSPQDPGGGGLAGSAASSVNDLAELLAQHQQQQQEQQQQQLANAGWNTHAAMTPPAINSAAAALARHTPPQQSLPYQHQQLLGPPSARAGPRIFIGKINHETSEQDVKEYFGQFGYVLDVYLPRDRTNKREHRGFGFVTFETEASVQRVVSNGAHYIRGSVVAIDAAVPRQEDKEEVRHQQRQQQQQQQQQMSVTAVISNAPGSVGGSVHGQGSALAALQRNDGDEHGVGGVQKSFDKLALDKD